MTLRLSLLALGVLAFSSISSTILQANAGIFTGNGYDIMLTQSGEIEMVSEDIVITPGRGMFFADGSAHGLDRVKYDCVFKLKNLSKTAVTVQAGFPLDSQGLAHQRMSRAGKRNAEPLTLRDYFGHYRFIAHDGETTYPLRFVATDKDKKFRHLFVWDMTFQPGAMKTLYVTYEMGMSMGAGSTLRDKNDVHMPGNADWMLMFTGSLVEFFGYVTETGKSWAGGRIGHAKFTLNLNGFEEYFFNRPMVEGAAGTDKKMLERFPVMRPVGMRIIKPKAEEWKNTGNGNLTRTIKQYAPDENIEVIYFMSNMPQTSEDTERLIAWLRKEGFAKTPATADADHDLLRDFFKIFNGERTENATANALAKKQVWFGVTQPRKIPEIVFETLARLRADDSQ